MWVITEAKHLRFFPVETRTQGTIFKPSRPMLSIEVFNTLDGATQCFRVTRTVITKRNARKEVIDRHSSYSIVAPPCHGSYKLTAMSEATFRDECRKIFKSFAETIISAVQP